MKKKRQFISSYFNRSLNGETACESSRKPIEVNKRLFNVDDVSPSYSRKIDMILKYDDNKNVELCSNEWKRNHWSFLFDGRPFLANIIIASAKQLLFISLQESLLSNRVSPLPLPHVQLP
jgi:hypothetical protein